MYQENKSWISGKLIELKNKGLKYRKNIGKVTISFSSLQIGF